MLPWPKSCWVLFLGVVVGCSESKDSDESACVVAQHVDQCCSAPVAASMDELSKDGCLQRLERAPDVKACSASSDCRKVACAPRPIPSRVAGRTGGSCTFVNECESDSDCVLATNEAYCCGCPEWVPRTLVSVDPCLVAPGAQLSAECTACPAASEIACTACPTTTTTGRCIDGGNGYKTCVGQ